MKKFSLIIPAHNEETRIRKTLEEYGNFFRNKKIKKEIDFEIIVVINNTQDKTENIVREFSKKYPEIRYLNFKLGGKGFAIIEGFKETLKGNSEYIGFVDADMSTSAESFYDLIKTLDKNKIDGVIANRWDKRSNIKQKQTISRIIVSRLGNFIIRTLFLFNYPDTQCGAKIFNRKVIEKNIHKLMTINWGFDIALLFCLRKESRAKIISIPTVWEDKLESTLDLKKTPIRVFMSVIRLRLVHSPFNFVVRAYRKLPLIMRIK
jgi:glycosyltransferase involved in cell wall biosynthesis